MKKVFLELWGGKLGKKAVIMIRLVEESAEKPNAEIEGEIFEELSAEAPKIPWFKSAEKVTVVEET
jgi:hypothetical protein